MVNATCTKAISRHRSYLPRLDTGCELHMMHGRQNYNIEQEN
jgi:hypothetical protein